MAHSMTAFATTGGQGAGYTWIWELRGVNGKGLDMRMRLPDWIGGLEQAARSALQARLARGSVTLGLKIARDPGAVSGAGLDPAALDAALTQIHAVEEAARAKGIALRPTSATEILSIRGVTEAQTPAETEVALRKALLADLERLLDAFVAMRRSEGAALIKILGGQLDNVQALTKAAEAEAEARQDHVAETLRANLARVLDNSSGADPDRVAQELALIAVKSDVREELDRLGAHVEAARTLLASDEPLGRKLDFLMQEFNREANTLCSKAQSSGLTRIGLDLKAAIDQMREQVQNVE
ncbi:hypothetical protein RGUI_0296 [Rhodovulum sp. P5]|uniref:YicC/YloC family endoribonuclease n=1 Tax=Rhodovulum sp. P5 TaxID=1564506 RepID=UPI0009C34372|nr:YicC/YloC family endoribonuclease [Rhodovulum sp. P5]ARE38437.1 hypothetical protein RGUI_0296 [Rhodovulum sp. P5]